MLRLLRIDEILLALPKPALEPLEHCVLEKGDCLVTCAGFEDRSLGIVQKLSLHTNEFESILIRYNPESDHNKEFQISDILKTLGGRVTTTTYDRENPAGFGGRLAENLENVQGRVLIDISAMSRLLIVQVIVALKSTAMFERSVVLYTEAQSYPPTEQEIMSFLEARSDDPTLSLHLLSSGVFDITIVPELSALSMSGEQSRLVAFPSFNVEQLAALRGELQPSRIVLGHGIPPDPKYAWRRNAIATLNSTEQVGAEEEWDLSTLDYRDTLERLLELYSEHNERDRIIVCPIGSKMQSVGVALFRAFLDDVQIVYPTPREFYPDRYTTGIGRSYSLHLRFFALVK